jgi:hypothetical protein
LKKGGGEGFRVNDTGGSMAKRRKKAEKAGENVVDYRHKSVKRLNIPPAG